MSFINRAGLRIIIPVLLLFAFRAGLAQNLNISNGLFFDGEPCLAVDPSDPEHLVTAWMGYIPFDQIAIRTRASFDGGRTWSPAAVIPHASASWTSADPSLAFGPQGDVFLSYVDYRKNPDSGAVFVVRSSDGGLSWQGRSRVIDAYADGSKKPIDRPWLSIDRSGGPYSGMMYVTTKPAPWIPPPNRPYFIRSSDVGQSWQAWRYLDTLNWFVGPWIAGPMAAPVAGSGGVFHAVYPSWELSQSLFPRFILASSANGGSSFSYQEVIQGASGVSDTLSKRGYRLAADPSDPQHLAFFFISSVFGDPDLVMTETKDGGASWTALIRINDDPMGNGRMQDLAWADFDISGNLAAAWRDRRHAQDTGYVNPYEIYATVKWRDSASFSPNVRISDTIVQFDSILMAKGNDFMGTCLARDTLLSVWGDTRNGSLNIWFQRTPLKSQGPSEIRPIACEPRPWIRMGPNPVNVVLVVEAPGLCRIRIFGLKGDLMLSMDKGLMTGDGLRKIEAGTENLVPGEYLLEATTSAGIVIARLIKK